MGEPGGGVEVLVMAVLAMRRAACAALQGLSLYRAG